MIKHIQAKLEAHSRKNAFLAWRKMKIRQQLAKKYLQKIMGDKYWNLVQARFYKWKSLLTDERYKEETDVFKQFSEQKHNLTQQVACYYKFFLTAKLDLGFKKCAL